MLEQNTIDQVNNLNNENIEQRNTIPDRIKEYEGIYIGNKMFKVTFPDEYTLCLSTCDEMIDSKQTYSYVDNDIFHCNDNGYMSMYGV